MRLRCPGCGLKAGAEAFGNDAVARDFVVEMGKLPSPLPAVLLSYLAFFRPEKTDMAWSKALRLTKELAALAAKRSVQYGHNPARPCPPSLWAHAIEKMLGNDTIKRPLPNHNYLIKVAWGLADEADMQVERRRNAAEKTGDVSALKRLNAETLKPSQAEPGLESMTEAEKAMLPAGIRKQLGV